MAEVEAKPHWRQRFNIQKLLKRNTGDPNATRLKRREALITKVSQKLPLLRYVYFIALLSIIVNECDRLLLFFVGYLWMLVIPHFSLGQRIYIDENALQPGHAVAHWNWGDVRNADQFLQKIEGLRDSNATSEQ
jgi:GPI-anchor transamidase subunit GAA1